MRVLFFVLLFEFYKLSSFSSISLEPAEKIIVTEQLLKVTHYFC